MYVIAFTMIEDRPGKGRPGNPTSNNHDVCVFRYAIAFTNFRVTLSDRRWGLCPVWGGGVGDGEPGGVLHALEEVIERPVYPSQDLEERPNDDVVPEKWRRVREECVQHGRVLYVLYFVSACFR